jgi:Flp pilus assembly protein TadG
VARRNESGAVTAETAVALPLLAVFAVSMAWLVSLGITQVRALDAARETARAAARSEGPGEALALGRRVAPTGSRISVGRGGGSVVVTVTSPVRGPAGLFGHWATFEVRTEAVAAEEPTS